MNKKERNRILCEFAMSHPTLNQEDIAFIFGIDRSRVSRIMAREKKRRDTHEIRQGNQT
jgi:predicted XRE-type DNA-binding protein